MTRRARIVLHVVAWTVGVLGATAGLSWLGTVKTVEGSDPPTLVDVDLKDAARGTPIQGARATSLFGGVPDAWLKYPSGHTSDAHGRIALLSTGVARSGGTVWYLWWLIRMGETSPRYEVRFEHPAYAPLTLGWGAVCGDVWYPTQRYLAEHDVTVDVTSTTLLLEPIDP